MYRQKLRAFATLLVVALCGSAAGLGGAAPARAAITPALPASLGTATVTTDGAWNFTLNGSITVGSGTFTGTASGTAPAPLGYPPVPHTPIPAFTLAGPGLTGTCSGQWLMDPMSFDPSGLMGMLNGFSPVFLMMPPAVVNVASLSCTLQLGGAPPAQTGLTLALVADDPPANTHLTGLYGPGLSSVPVPVPRSRGLADRTGVGVPISGYGYHLLGDIELGGQMFRGDASGSVPFSAPSAPFPLTGTSPSGDLAATCAVPATPLDGVGAQPPGGPLTLLSCTGHVGSGPVGTTTLLLALPIASGTSGGCGGCEASDETGVFLAP
jgi:hypothetical protein